MNILHSWHSLSDDNANLFCAYQNLLHQRHQFFCKLSNYTSIMSNTLVKMQVMANGLCPSAGVHQWMSIYTRTK